MEKNKFHILGVDDDDKIRGLIKQFLIEKGFIVSTAMNAKEAKTKIDTFNFNLIILDVMMPGQSGYELTEELKQSKNIPVILLTAKGETESRIHGLELGADDYKSENRRIFAPNVTTLSLDKSDKITDEGRALLYQRILLTDDIRGILDLSFMLKNSFLESCFVQSLQKHI